MNITGPLLLFVLLQTAVAQDAPFKPQRPEFEAIAQRLDKSSNEYLGMAQIPMLEARLASKTLTPDERVVTEAVLSQELLRLGRNKEASVHVDRALELVASTSPRLPDLHRLRAKVYLRMAEVENCIARHNADCCIFPLAGGGVHTQREPALRAKAAYLEFLRARRELGAAWVLNILAMALGEHPEGLPADLRIPMDRFASQYDIGRFPDIAPKLGLDALNLCGGCIVDDFDGDGYLDVLVSSFDPHEPISFYRNNQDGSFEDRSTASRLDDQLGGFNSIAGDYDGDGDLDVFVLRGGWLLDEGRIRNSLLRNDGGVFVDVTRAAGLAEPAMPTQTGAWFDYDNDGDLDLYVGNETRDWEEGKAHYPCQLYRNDGDGTFTDVAAQAGVLNDRFCKGVAAGDYDNDGDMDLYVSNHGPNRLYRNEGDGTFVDVAPKLGLTHPEGRSFATWFFDFDNDGWLDLFVSAFDAQVDDVAAEAVGLPYDASFPCLYRNNGDGTFTNVAGAMNLHHPFLPMGANFGDLDHDGWLDIYLGTGDPLFENLMPNVMLRNAAGKTFQDVTVSGGFGHLQKGHGIAFADIDNDGDQDVFHQLGGFFPGDRFKNVLFENPGHGARHLYVELRGTRTNRRGVGARIAVVIDTPSGPRTLHRAVGSVSSFGGSPLRQEIGLADATAIRSLTVSWPTSQSVQTFADIPLDTFVRVTEGSDVLERIELATFKLDGVPKAQKEK